MAEKKITKVDRFTKIIDLLNAGADVFNDEEFTADCNAAIEFIELQIKQLKDKAARKSSAPTPKQLEKLNEQNEIIAEIRDVLGAAAASGEDELQSLTIKDMQGMSELLGTLSNQKISSLLRKMKDAGEVNREEIKGKAHFSLNSFTPEPEDAETDDSDE